MDSLPSPLVLHELGFSVAYDGRVPGGGIIGFPYQGSSIDVSNVDLVAFSRLMRSAAYAAALYGVCGGSYVETTDISVGFFCDDGRLCFRILEGIEPVFSKPVDMLRSLREVGQLSLWVVDNPFDPDARLDPIGTPRLRFDTSGLAG